MKIRIGQVLSFCRIGHRPNQEDARFPDMDYPPSTQRFFVVCDGVGGTELGEVASTTVCQAFAKMMHEVDFMKDFTNVDFLHVLDEAFDALDRKSRQLNDNDFATTLAFAAFHEGGGTLAHIGDSRIYQFRKDIGIVYRSDDHSLVNQLVHKGLITADEAIDHPQNHVITRSMEPVEFDENRSPATVYRTSDIQDGDCFLLCTDGVYGCFDEEELARLFSLSANIEEAFSVLAAKCEESSDNNTAFLISIAEVENTEVNKDASVITTSISTSLTDVQSESQRQ
ncbi:MAG: serine/threonine-protein phosphatase [Prevotella sp.]|nr:serine/threonine-protein phosphatase [Prevotella sp.]